MREVNCAVVPSNQDYSVEQSIQKPTGDEIVAEIKRQGIATGNPYDAKLFFRPGSYDGSKDNIPELGWMLDQSVAWLKTKSSATRCSVSNHSNAGITTIVNIQPQLTMSDDIPWGTAAGYDLANRVGGHFQKVRVRTLMYMTHMKFMGPHRSILHETGNHEGAWQAAYLGKYARFHGIMIARNFLVSLGAPVIDGAVPGDVIVPTGSGFDRWRPGVILPPDPKPPEITLPMIRLTDPYMRDSRTGDFALSYNILEYPIHWVQDGLAEHTYRQGYTFKYVDKYGVNKTADIRALDRDGIAGPMTTGAIKHFQAEHYDIEAGQPLKVDGIVGDLTWGKMRVVF